MIARIAKQFPPGTAWVWQAEFMHRNIADEHKALSSICLHEPSRSAYNRTSQLMERTDGRSDP